MRSSGNGNGVHAISELSRWRPFHLSLLAFPMTPILGVDQNWWREVVGNEPDDYVSTNRKHNREDKGRYEDGTLSLFINHGDVSWVLSPRADLLTLAEDLPAAGSFPARLARFVDLMCGWLSRFCPPINRLAFSARLVQLADDRLAALDLLRPYVPHVQIDEDGYDLLYRINRKRQSGTIPELAINRISIWAANSVWIGSNDHPQFPPREFHNCNVELDVNTTPGRTEELPHDRLPELFEELASLALEIATRGDVR